MRKILMVLLLSPATMKMSENPGCGCELQIALTWLEPAACSLAFNWGIDGKEDPCVLC